MKSIEDRFYSYQEVKSLKDVFSGKEKVNNSGRKIIFFTKDTKKKIDEVELSKNISEWFRDFSPQGHFYSEEENILYIKLSRIENFFLKKNQYILDLIRETYSFNTRVIKVIRGKECFLEKNIKLINESAKERENIVKRVSKKENALLKNSESSPLLFSWSFTFLGGAEEVGRNCMYFRNNSKEFRISFIIDCGCGFSKQKEFPMLEHIGAEKIEDLDFIILTHAHADHHMSLRFLLKYGFKGPIYMTEPTRDLTSLGLQDGIKLNQYFSQSDINRVISQTFSYEYGQELSPFRDFLKIKFINSGHILGSAGCQIIFNPGTKEEKTLFLTSDYKYNSKGFFTKLNIREDKNIDVVLTEATYGSSYSKIKNQETLLDILKEIEWNNNTRIMIPSFSIGRAQEVLYQLLTSCGAFLKEKNIKLYVEGIIQKTSLVHITYSSFLKKEVRKKLFFNKDSLFFSPIVNYDLPKSEFELLEPQIIVATAGMMTGGPVVKHFLRNYQNKDAHVFFIGYQSRSSLGYFIQTGDSEKIKKILSIEKEVVPLYKVKVIDLFSGHATRPELNSFANNIDRKWPNAKIYYFHGEPKSLANMVSQKNKAERIVAKNLEEYCI